jgi:ATP-dependent protease ClpP protease subunit
MRTFLAVLLVSVATWPCAAANIEVKDNKIFIVGTIEADDFDVFEAKVQPFNQPMTVILHSNGGSLAAALRIGRLIRRKGWNTSVEYMCFSACASLWLAGVKRFKTEKAQIAFHSALDKRTGQVSALGNREVSFYLADLGYSPEVAKFTTAPPPNEKVFLSDDDAKRLGIAMTIVAPTIPMLAFQSVDLNKQPTPTSPKVSKMMTRLYDPDDLIPGTSSAHRTPRQPRIIRPNEATPCTSQLGLC